MECLCYPNTHTHEWQEGEGAPLAVTVGALYLFGRRFGHMGSWKVVFYLHTSWLA